VDRRYGYWIAVGIGAASAIGWVLVGLNAVFDWSWWDPAPYAMALTGASLGTALLAGPFTAAVQNWSGERDRRFKQFEYERDRVQALSKGVAGTAAGVLTNLVAAGLTSSASIDVPPRVVVGTLLLAGSLLACGLYGNLSTRRLAETLR
jgi:hypothetical protein